MGWKVTALVPKSVGRIVCLRCIAFIKLHLFSVKAVRYRLGKVHLMSIPAEPT